MAMIFGGAFVLSLIAAYVFGMFLGQSMPLAGAVGAGFAAGLCWVGASFGINYLFERRPLGLWLINAGYHTLQFTLFGLILGSCAKEHSMIALLILASASPSRRSPSRR